MTSLYIHIPFCKSKCLFCSFVIAVGKEHRTDVYLEALALEAQKYRRQNVETIYIGGGTPTHMGIAQLGKLLKLIKENFQYEPNVEFTIEANPEDMDAEKADVLRREGVNRISLGVQSFNDKYLSFLGRGHDRTKAIEAFCILKNAGFSNINLDLMFSFPEQTLAELEEDVQVITALGSDHLSLYSLTIEEGSRFFCQNMKLDSTEKQTEYYNRIVELLEKAGFRQYEISNFAKAGKESRHNQVYWQGGNYMGLGIGAHSHINGERFWNTSNFSDYLEKAKNGLSTVEGHEVLGNSERFMETLLLGLRMTKGIEVQRIEEQFKEMLSWKRKEKIKDFIKEGFLTEDGISLKTTPKGRLVLDEICARLI